MKNYLVTWVIDIEAESAEKAAEQAYAIQQDPFSIATLFTVTDDEGNKIITDIGDNR